MRSGARSKRTQVAFVYPPSNLSKTLYRSRVLGRVKPLIQAANGILERTGAVHKPEDSTGKEVFELVYPDDERVSGLVE